MTLTIKGATTIKAATTVGFSPASLFAAGEQGVWYDPSDFSTMFQDTAGTTPVTATGQSVARINDKSGRGNNATQSTAGYRPTLQQDANGCYYLSFDGTDDGLFTGSIDFTSTFKMNIFTGLRKTQNNPTIAVFAEIGPNSDTNSGSFVIAAPVNTKQYYFQLNAGSRTDCFLLSGYASPVTNVVVVSYDTTQSTTLAQTTARINATLVSLGYVGSNAGNSAFGNYPLYVGGRTASSLFFAGNLYSLIIRGAASTSTQIAAAEGWVNSKTRAY